MEILYRRVQTAPNGQASTVDSTLQTERLLVGSSAECAVQLIGREVGLKHAYIDGTVDNLRLRCTRGHWVTHNGKKCSRVQLKSGDVVEIAGHRLILLPAPAGFDCAIEILPNPSVAPNEYEASFKTDLRQTWLSARSLSWTGLLAVIAISLLAPLYMIDRHRHHAPSLVGLPDDNLWSSGPLSPAHAHAAGRQCNVCHQQMFSRVQDTACRGCHQNIKDHVPEAHRNFVAASDSRRCGACHKEHVGEIARAVMRDDTLCVGCHANADQKFPTLRLENVKAFEPGAHPAFFVQLQKSPDGAPRTARDVPWVRFRQALQGAKEISNLRFSHAEHLDPEKVRSESTGAALGCADCHQLDDGDHFKSIAMRKSCANSGCHQLNFDLLAPERQLPHAQPEEAMAVIQDYFNRRYTDPPPKRAVLRNRPVPDIDPSKSIDADACEGTPIACARKRAAAEIEIQFNGKACGGLPCRGCAGCHEIEDNHKDDVQERFHVIPVRLNERYFPDLKFSHRTHRTQGSLTGDEACESCHHTRRSDVATDVLLPNVDRCLTCHRDMQGEGMLTTHLIGDATSNDPATRVVTLQCTSCHEYHPTASWSAQQGTL